MVRFFDRFKTNERNPEATKTGWETLAIPTVEEKKVVENPRQQRKIAYCLTTGDYSAIDKHDVDTPVSEDEFLQRLGAGEITKTDERQMLIQIATPAYGGKYQAVVDKIRQNKHHSRILGNFSGVGFDNYANVDDTAVKNFLTQYPTPIDFDKAEQDFLKSIHDYNDEEKYQEYQRDMASFKKQNLRKAARILGTDADFGEKGQRAVRKWI